MDAHGIDYDAREFFKQPFERDGLTAVLDRAGMKPSELVATRSAPYRAERLCEQDLSEDDVLERMLGEPRLIRRPILVTDDGVTVGFNQDRYDQLATRLTGADR